MPGYVIHLAVGQEYAKRKKINDLENFLNGCIAPDLMEKADSHYFGDDRISRFKKVFRK